MPFIHLDDQINHSILSGLDSAQLLIEYNNNIIHSTAYGNADTHTLFDIASLTKIFSITYLIQYYHDHNLIDLNSNLAEIFPNYFNDDLLKDKANITIKMLLAHEAGFQPNPLFYDQNYNKILFCQDRENFLEKLLQAPLIHTPQQKSLYSDVDFMLLTFVLEKVFKQRIDKQLNQIFPLFYDHHICYTPLKYDYQLSKIAPTELYGNTRDHSITFKNIRTELIHGQVQDEKAFHCMNEVSGHAGLFSNCKTILQLLNLMTNQPPFFSQQTQDMFLHSQCCDLSFGLGWRLNKDSEMDYHFGNYASSAAYGHTGWTGAVFVVDPVHSLKIIYLTNRKHSKVIDPVKNPHQFFGDTLWAGKYKNVMNEIYSTLGINL